MTVGGYKGSMRLCVGLATLLLAVASAPAQVPADLAAILTRDVSGKPLRN